jgi:hypothetical protein
MRRRLCEAQLRHFPEPASDIPNEFFVLVAGHVSKIPLLMVFGRLTQKDSGSSRLVYAGAVAGDANAG